MKKVSLNEQQANLRGYLRMASDGDELLVQDDERAIARIGPARTYSSWRERMAEAGRLRRGTQTGGDVTVAAAPPVDIQRALSDVREEPGEVR